MLFFYYFFLLMMTRIKINPKHFIEGKIKRLQNLIWMFFMLGLNIILDYLRDEISIFLNKYVLLK